MKLVYNFIFSLLVFISFGKLAAQNIHTFNDFSKKKQDPLVSPRINKTPSSPVKTPPTTTPASPFCTRKLPKPIKIASWIESSSSSLLGPSSPSISLSSDGSRLALGNGKSLRLWDLKEQRCTLKVAGLATPIQGVIFGKDETYPDIAIMEKGTCWLMDRQEENSHLVFLQRSESPICDVVFESNAKIMVTSEEGINAFYQQNAQQDNWLKTKESKTFKKDLTPLSHHTPVKNGQAIAYSQGEEKLFYVILKEYSFFFTKCLSIEVFQWKAQLTQAQYDVLLKIWWDAIAGTKTTFSQTEEFAFNSLPESIKKHYLPSSIELFIARNRGLLVLAFIGAFSCIVGACTAGISFWTINRLVDLFLFPMQSSPFLNQGNFPVTTQAPTKSSPFLPHLGTTLPFNLSNTVSHP